MPKNNKLTTGHDFAALAQQKGAKNVTSWGGQGPNNYYRVDGQNNESVVFPANNLSRGTRFNILNALLRMGMIVLIGGTGILLLVAEAASRGLIK